MNMGLFSSLEILIAFSKDTEEKSIPVLICEERFVVRIKQKIIK